MVSGQECEIIVRHSDELPQLKSNRSATIIRLPDDPGQAEKIISNVPLADSKPQELLGKAKPLLPGRYAIELTIPDWQSELQSADGPLRATFVVASPDQIELVNTTPDQEWLDTITKTTKGKLHTIDTLDELVESLKKREATRTINIISRLRESWWLYGLIVGLLTIDWTIRKWHGMK
jgi:hypothetical protein